MEKYTIDGIQNSFKKFTITQIQKAGFNIQVLEAGNLIIEKKGYLRLAKLVA